MSSPKLNIFWQSIKITMQNLFAARFWKIIPILTLFFIAGIVWYNWRTVQNQEWSWRRLLWLGKAFGLYPFSLLLLLVNWNDIMEKLGASVKMVPSSYIYCINVINRRLPMGLFWSAGGRINAYNEYGVTTGTIMTALSIEFLLHGFSSFLLWIILELSGYGYIPTLAVVAREKIIIIVIGSLFSLGIILVLWLQYRKRFLKMHPLNHISRFQWVKWVLIYGFTWVNAGIMLFFVIQAFSNHTTISIEHIVATWALVGVVGYVFSTLPFVDIGSKELSLAFLLSQSMPLVQSVLVAIIFRLLLTVSDAIWPLLFATGLRVYHRVDRNI